MKVFYSSCTKVSGSHSKKEDIQNKNSFIVSVEARIEVLEKKCDS